MEVLIQIAQLILSLSILVSLHELGHFLPAKWFKARVDKFYLFFDPWFSVVKKKIGETEYGIGWLPFGGYVKIAGMVDESMDTENLNKTPQPWEFRSKPAWQRLIIMLGGVTVNVILAFAIYTGLLFSQGEQYLPAEDARFGFVADSLAREIGLQTGDRILSYDGGKPFQSVNSIVPQITLDNAMTLEVERNGKPEVVKIPQRLYKDLIKSGGGGFVSLAFPAEIGGFAGGSVLQKAGAKEGDRIISLNGSSVQYFEEVRILLRGLRNKSTAISLLRGSDTVQLSLSVPASGLLGFTSKPADQYFQLKTREYSLMAAIPAGAEKTWTTLVNYIKQFRLLFNPEMEGYKQIGSFITITKLFPKGWDWVAFWNLTAFLSIMLAFINVLPIPALDGGHALFTIYEMITGHKPGEKFLERAQMAGMILLLSLMVYALGNDIFRNLF